MQVKDILETLESSGSILVNTFDKEGILITGWQISKHPVIAGQYCIDQPSRDHFGWGAVPLSEVTKLLEVCVQLRDEQIKVEALVYGSGS